MLYDESCRTAVTILLNIAHLFISFLVIDPIIAEKCINENEYGLFWYLRLEHLIHWPLFTYCDRRGQVKCGIIFVDASMAVWFISCIVIGWLLSCDPQSGGVTKICAIWTFSMTTAVRLGLRRLVTWIFLYSHLKRVFLLWFLNPGALVNIHFSQLNSPLLKGRVCQFQIG